MQFFEESGWKLEMIQFVKRDDIFFPEGSVFGSFQDLFCFLIFHCCLIIPSRKGKDGQPPFLCCNLLGAALHRICWQPKFGSLGQRELQHRHRWIRWDILAGPFPLTPKVCNSCFNTSVETPLIWPTSTRPWIMLMNVYLRGSWVAASCLWSVLLCLQGHGSDFESFETCMISDQCFQYLIVFSSISNISWYRSGHLTIFDIWVLRRSYIRRRERLYNITGWVHSDAQCNWGESTFSTAWLNSWGATETVLDDFGINKN